MSVLMSVYILLVMAFTTVAGLIWRPVVAAAVLLGLVWAGFAAPFVFFGSWAVIAGEPLSETLAQVSAVLPALYDIAGYTVFWSLVGLVSAAVLRSGLIFVRRKLA